MASTASHEQHSSQSGKVDAVENSDVDAVGSGHADNVDISIEDDTLTTGIGNNEESHAVYQQLPLPEGHGDYTRLLRVLPGSDDDPLVCELRTVALDERPDFAALSYTWGPPIFDHQITLNGSQFMITASLSGALRTFRTRKWQVIWVDAVCIDQSNLKERSQQVLLMQRIYSQAMRVFVYLGDTDCKVSPEEIER